MKFQSVKEFIRWAIRNNFRIEIKASTSGWSGTCYTLIDQIYDTRSSRTVSNVSTESENDVLGNLADVALSNRPQSSRTIN